MKGDVPYWGANGVVDSVSRALIDGPIVLLGEDGAPFFDSLKDKAFFVDEPIWPNNHIHVLRPASNVLGRYLAYALNSTDYASFIEGSTRDKLTQSQMTSIPVALPPLGEQDTIVEFLDRETAEISALIAKQNGLIATLREERAATITHCATRGIDEFVDTKPSEVDPQGSCPAHWSIRQFRTTYRESDVRRGGREDLELLSVSIHLGVRPRSELITDKEPRADDLSNYKVCEKGDVVLNRMRAFQGGLGVCPQHGIVSPDYMVMKINAAESAEYIGYLMMSTWFVDRMTSQLRGIGAVDQGNARTPRINPRDLGTIKVALPPRQEQLRIATFIADRCATVDSLIAKSTQVIATLREYRSALVRAAVTGKIDLREAA